MDGLSGFAASEGVGVRIGEAAGLAAATGVGVGVGDVTAVGCGSEDEMIFGKTGWDMALLPATKVEAVE